jgi:hypothetical protein
MVYCSYKEAIMNEAQITHARRALACPRWRWMAGMLGYFEHDGRRVRVTMPDAWASTTALPDLTDPATLGCLLALLGHDLSPEPLVTALEGAP